MAVNEQEFDASKRNKSRLKLIGLFMIAGGPVVIAMLMYFGGFAIPEAKTNKGDLILPPVPFEKLVSTNGKTDIDTFLENQKWALVVASGKQCDESCESLLHLTRQVHVSMGREMKRVSRYLVAPKDDVPQQDRYAAYSGLNVVNPSQSQVNAFQALANENSKGADIQNDSWNVWIVDPLGNVMMHYSQDHTGYDMIDDLKRLLKLSKIG